MALTTNIPLVTEPAKISAFSAIVVVVVAVVVILRILGYGGGGGNGDGAGWGELAGSLRRRWTRRALVGPGRIARVGATVTASRDSPPQSEGWHLGCRLRANQPNGPRSS